MKMGQSTEANGRMGDSMDKECTYCQTGGQRPALTLKTEDMENKSSLTLQDRNSRNYGSSAKSSLDFLCDKHE